MIRPKRKVDTMKQRMTANENHVMDLMKEREALKAELEQVKAERDKLRKDYDNLIELLVETYSL